MVEFLGVCPRSLMDEFRNPPDPKDLGDKGILVLSLNGDRVRLPVDRSLSGGETAHLGGWEVKVTRYSPDPQAKDDPKAPPAYPVVEFQLKSADGKETADLATAARDAGHLEEVQRRPAALAGLQVWYHPPDYQYGRTSHEGQRDGLRALMQLVQGDDGKLYYRSFSTSRLGKFAFEKAGEARPGKGELAIWTGMNWKFQLDEYLPAAVAEDKWVPEDLRPGSERNGYYPAALCQITKDGKKSKEFWVLQFNDATPVSVTDHDYYTVSYTMRTQDLGFSLRLLRAEQTNDAGTQSAATYTSFVQLTDDEQKIKDEDHVITMNAPLHHRGYKLYQSGYELIGVESGSQKPISKTTLTVGYDPGIYLKYLGQIMLGVGIFTMFYMKAYFFKPRRRVVPAAATTNGTPPQEG
jgi:hypothetical protein